MRISLKVGILFLAIVLLPLTMLAACGGGGGDDIKPPPVGEITGTPTPEPKLSVVIGNLTDLTGPSANAMEIINTALDDVVKYYNENNLIPGVELKVVTYDGQFDPSKDIPGYEWLRSKGADLIWTCVPPTPITLKAKVNEDRVPLLAAAVPIDELYPPGYVFCIGIIPQQEAYTLLPWIAENDWDYTTKGPAKIGGVGWPDTYCPTLLDSMKEYAQAHPEQFNFVGSYFNDYSFNWDAEASALSDADYVFPNSVLVSFVKQYRNAGGKAKFIGTDPVTAFFGLVDDANIWDEMDGALFIRSSRWFNERGTLIDLTNKIIEEDHPGQVEEIKKAGCGYLGFNNAYQAVEIIKSAVEMAGGAENLDSQTFYEATQSMDIVIDGVPRYSFNKDKRTAVDSLGIYRLDASRKDIFRADPEWYPVRNAP